MKKKRPLILLVLAFFTFLSIGVKATTKAQSEVLISTIDGASIRTKTENSEQGLRFYAKVDESVKNNEHGFYLVFGNVTTEELSESIRLQTENEIVLNDKIVFKVVVRDVREDNTYSVILTGIPEVGYFDVLSVIPYVVHNDKEIYAEPISRSIASVILKMSNEGEDISNIVSLDKVIKTDRRRIIENNNNFFIFTIRQEIDIVAAIITI